MLFEFLLVTLLVASPSVVNSAEYPTCWIKKGECLDNNEPQLVEWVKPQINHNVIGDSIENVTSVTQCSEKCFDNPECRSVSILNYYTYVSILLQRLLSIYQIWYLV